MGLVHEVALKIKSIDLNQAAKGYYLAGYLTTFNGEEFVTLPRLSHDFSRSSLDLARQIFYNTTNINPARWIHITLSHIKDEADRFDNYGNRLITIYYECQAPHDIKLVWDYKWYSFISLYNKERKCYLDEFIWLV